MSRKLKTLLVSLALLGLVLYTACNYSKTDVPPTTAPAVQVNEADHAHKPGAHGGIIVPIGRDNYHAEAIFAKDGVVRLFMLGKDESTILEVDSQTLTAYVKAEGEELSDAIAFKPEPQPDDPPGKTSVFVGQVPASLVGKKLEVTIPNIRIAGVRFRFSFRSLAETHAAAMPPKLADEDERKLYLTPGGKYTAADIKANGQQTGSQKYQNFRAAHDLAPKPGDPTCPVTETKANPKCTWIVGGKTYQFCCPPCIDEFVKLAKEQPDKVKEPAEYTQK